MVAWSAQALRVKLFFRERSAVLRFPTSCPAAKTKITRERGALGDDVSGVLVLPGAAAPPALFSSGSS